MVTPLYIEIALHYCTTTGDFPRLPAPACSEAITEFLERGLLAMAREDEPVSYRATAGLHIWLAGLCSVPFPEQRWVTPKANKP